MIIVAAHPLFKARRVPRMSARNLIRDWRSLSVANESQDRLTLDDENRQDYASSVWRQTMKRLVAIFAVLFSVLPLAAQNNAAAQTNIIRPSDNLVLENLPPVPASLADKANQYGEFRGANLQDWDSVKREMLIATRFADVQQIHRVKMPGGDRSQLTFFPDRVGGAHYSPEGDYFVFSKDVGGGEWFQFYRYDLSDGKVTLLTDGKSRNTGASRA